jgi:hypothetical protein
VQNVGRGIPVVVFGASHPDSCVKAIPDWEMANLGCTVMHSKPTLESAYQAAWLYGLNPIRILLKLG